MANTMQWGYRTAYRIGCFPEPNREALPPQINRFCKKLGKSFDINIKAINDIPNHHALWVGNHISWLDVAVVGSFSPAFFLSKSEVRSWPLIGRLAAAAGTLFIKRGSGDAGSIKDQIAGFLQQGISVLFFPEATTTDGKQVKKLHGKLLQAALDTGVQVQPVVMCYVNEAGELDQVIPFIGDMTFGTHLKNVLANGNSTAYIMALDAIDPAGHDKASLTALLEENMRAGLAQLHEQVLK